MGNLLWVNMILWAPSLTTCFWGWLSWDHTQFTVNMVVEFHYLVSKKEKEKRVPLSDLWCAYDQFLFSLDTKDMMQHKINSNIENQGIQTLFSCTRRDIKDAMVIWSLQFFGGVWNERIFRIWTEQHISLHLLRPWGKGFEILLLCGRPLSQCFTSFLFQIYIGIGGQHFIKCCLFVCFLCSTFFLLLNSFVPLWVDSLSLLVYFLFCR